MNAGFQINVNWRLVYFAVDLKLKHPASFALTHAKSSVAKYINDGSNVTSKGDWWNNVTLGVNVVPDYFSTQR